MERLKPSLFEFTPCDLIRTLSKSQINLDSNHCKIIFKALYQSFFHRTDQTKDSLLKNLTHQIPKEVLQTLKNHFSLKLPKILHHNISNDGTHKILVGLDDGHSVETVLIPFRKKYTICLSTQVGCAMGCKFCHTATMGLKRNLQAHEIINQYLLALDILKNEAHLKKETLKKPNIVFMGQGEPLDNFDNVHKAIEFFLNKQTLYLGPRQITLSTVGPMKYLKKLKELPPINIAFSLHSPYQEQREAIIPIAKTSHLDMIFEQLDSHKLMKKQFITFEYLVIKDFNHSKAHAEKIAEYLRPRKAILNLIPFNPIPNSPYMRPSNEQVEKFQEELVHHKLRVMVRTTKGDEIMAACGQLKSQVYAS